MLTDFTVAGTPFTYRPLRSGDAAALTAFLAGLSAGSRRFWHGDADDADTAAGWIEAIDRYDKVRFVVHQAGRDDRFDAVVDLSLSLPEGFEPTRYEGYGIVLDPARTVRFGPCVADAWHGRGLAAALMPPTWAAVRRLGRDRVVLFGGVHADNARAQGFYRRCGFVEAGRFTTEDGPCVDMVLDLAPLTAAEELVAARFPEATWAILTGSVIGPHRTAGSDLDIVVLRESGPVLRESLRFRGWPVELFVHTPDRLAGFLASELAARKPSTHRMLARGVLLRGDPGDLLTRCARVLAEGPPPLTEAERDRFRYVVTDLLDDHTHAADPGERDVIAAALWTETARAALAFAGRWVSSGKWLLRELRELDHAFAARWLTARGDPAPLATEVLAGAGGPLFEGYRVEAP